MAMAMTIMDLGALQESGALAAVDRQLAMALVRRADERSPEVALAVALASRAVRVGHVCLDVGDVAASPPTNADGEAVDGPWPPTAAWLATLAASPVVGGASDATPLVLEGDRLYLRRFFDHEVALADALRHRLVARPAFDAALLAEGLARLFPDPGDGAIDLQRAAAAVAVAHRLTVITGGPGTGKTTTVARVLALLVEQAQGAGVAVPRTLLLAPTGKAAARLEASVGGAREQLAVAPAALAALPAEATTIHRALGARPGGGFARGPDRPLAADVVIVDEASMIDVALMRRLVDAVAEHARLILLGDRDQLASIEAGAVLGDLCGPGTPWRPSSGLVAAVGPAVAAGWPAWDDRDRPAPPDASLADVVVPLVRSWRFAADSGIGALARAINAGDVDGALDVLGGGRHPDVAWWPTARAADGLVPQLVAAAIDGYAPALGAGTPAARLARLDGFRVLCAHRSGPDGLERIGALIEAALADAGLIRPRGSWYDGRPVLIGRNDPALGLANGDLGLVLADPAEAGALRAWFPDGQDGARGLSPSRLPPHETAWAMSIHKAQGSEFDAVVVVLPREASPLLSRELLYTAVTRARSRVTVVASEAAIRTAVARRAQRASGLEARLWDDATRDQHGE